MTTPKVVSLGQELALEELFTDFDMTKTELASALNVTRPTIWRYDKIAYFHIKDYREAYPEETDPKKRVKSSRESSVPLCPYQVWVIAQIKCLLVKLKREARVKDYIKKNPNRFTRTRFEIRIRTLAKEQAQQTKPA